MKKTVLLWCACSLLLFAGCSGLQKAPTSDLERRVERSGLDIDVSAANNAVDIAYGGTDANDAATARQNLGLEIGVDVEAAQTQASQAEMEAGTESGIRSMSPLLVKQAIDALGSLSSLSSDLDSNLLDTDGSELDLDLQSPNYFFAGPSSGVDTGKPTFRTIVAGDLPAASATGIGAVELATTAEVVTGTDPERAVTPEGVTARLAAPGAIGGTTPAAGTFTTLEAASGAFEVDADGNVEGKSFLATKASGVAGKIWAYEANSTDTSKTGFEGPASTSADLYFKFSNDEPTAGQHMRFGAPSSNVSQISWAGGEVNGSSGITLTASQMSDSTVYNTGQAASDITITAGAAASRYAILFTVGTTQAANDWKFRAGTNDKIYAIAADGSVTAGDDNGYYGFATPAIGNAFACWTFKTDSYDWMCKCISGTCVTTAP